MLILLDPINWVAACD